MEPIQIYDPVKNTHFEVYVSREVAERCRIDGAFAEDLYCQIRDQNIEEGSTIEIQTEVLEDHSKNKDHSGDLDDFSKDATKVWSKDEISKLLKFYELLKSKLPRTTSSAILWNKIAKELSKKNVHKSANQCMQKWKNLKKSYKNTLEKPDKSRCNFFYEIDRIVKGIATPFSDDSEDDILDEDDPDWESELLADNKESWSRKETLAFLDVYLEHQESRHEYKTTIDFFTFLSEELAKHGIAKAPEKCANKWKNLLRTYKRLSNKLVPHSVRFPYFSEVNKIINSRTNDSDHEVIIDVSDIEDTADTPNTEQIIILSDNGNKESSLHLLKDDEAEEHINKKIYWQEDEITALIGIFKKYKDSYDNYAIKRQFWTVIANALDKEGFPGKDADKCKDKWRSLMHTYENYLNQNDGTFYFGEAMDDIFSNETKELTRDHTESNIIELDNFDDMDTELMETENQDTKKNIKKEWHGIEEWTYDESFNLIEAFRKFGDDYSFDSKNHVLWIQVSTYLETEGTHRSPEDCKKHWNDLYEMYVAHKRLNMNNSRFPFVSSMDSIFGNENEDEQDNYDMDNTNAKCKCKERVLAEKRKRHQDRIGILRRKLNIEERKVKAFEEYVHQLKRAS